MVRLHNLSSPYLLSCFPPNSLHADWLLLWPRLRSVPSSSVGAGSEYEYTQGSHWQVSLVITGQPGLRGRARGSWPQMIWICLRPTPRTSFQATVVLALHLMTSSEGDRRGLQMQMLIGSNNHYLQVPGADKCMLPEWAIIIISQGRLYRHQENLSIASLNEPPIASILTHFTRGAFKLCLHE